MLRSLRSAGWLVTLLLIVSIGRLATAHEHAAAELIAAQPAHFESQSDFISNCLSASGIHDACELMHLRSQYNELQGQIAPRSLRYLPVSERLQTLQARLHEVVLVGEYRKDASNLSQTLSRGDYNCLSATALYWELAREAGLDLEIWSLPGHVYLRATDSECTLVEPAAQDWHDTLPYPKPRAATARRLSPDQLVGKFYYNRGVLALERGEHATGVVLLRQSLTLDPLDAEARANLLAGLNNWAVERCRHEQYAAAQALIRQGLAIDGRFAPLLANEQFVRARLSSP